MTIYIDSSHLGTPRTEATQPALVREEQGAISENAGEKPTMATVEAEAEREEREARDLWQRFVVAPTRRATAAFAAGVVP